MRQVLTFAVLLTALLGLSLAWAGEALTGVQFSWDVVPGATRYEIQVARDRSFTKGLSTEVVEGTTWKTELVDTTYFWRVRGIDADGIPGVFSKPRPVKEKQRIRVVTPTPLRTPTPTPIGTPPPTVTPTPESTPEPTPVVTPTPSETPPPALWKRVPGSLGLRAGGYSNFGQVISPRVELELGSRLGVDSPWLVAVRPGYFRSAQSVSDGTHDAQSVLHAFPVHVSGRYMYSWAGFEWYGGAGALVTFLNASVEIPTQPRFTQSATEFGGLALVGIERKLGPGRLSLEADYLVSTPMDGFIVMDPGGVTFSLGYRLQRRDR